MVAVVLVLFVIWGGVAVIRAYAKQREAVVNRNTSIRELKEVKEKQAELSANIENLSTERGLEAEVRNRYRVAKPGEQLVIVVDNKEGSEDVTKKPSFWEKLRQFVGL
jgi:cell division protein FtsB